MRQRVTAVLMMTLTLLLMSCGRAENDLDAALAFRSRLQACGGCSFSAAITAEIDERFYEFTLAADAASGGATEITVTEPEGIAGIRATLTTSGAQLSFDGVELDFGKLDDALETPLYAPHVFSECWQSGYIDCAGMDGGALRVTYRLGYDEEELILETWFSEDLPVRCELYRGERCLLAATVDAFTFLS